MQPTDVERRSFLLSCATWQDQLLQTYRTLHIAIQAFLIAAGAAVLAVQMSGAMGSDQPAKVSSGVFSALFTSLLSFLYWLQHRTSSEMQGVVENRSRDVDYWHRRILKQEGSLQSADRIFTHFKIWQQMRRASAEHLPLLHPSEAALTDEQIDQLLTKGVSHTRQILDVNLFNRLRLLWLGILATSFGMTAWYLWLYSCSRVGA